MASMAPPPIIFAAQSLVATKYYLCAAMTYLLYDHIITFGDEVEHIWKRRKGLVSAIFFLNRYYGPIALTLVIIAFFDPTWSRETCEKFVAFEPFGFGIPLMVIPGTLLVLRLYALYDRSIYVLVFLSSILLSQTIEGIWQYAFPGGGPVSFPPIPGPVFQGCLYTASPKLGKVGGVYLVLQLVFDTSVFALIIFKTWRSFTSRGGPSLLRRISQDGALYFVAIFSTNAVWLFMVLFAPPEIQYLNAHPAITLVVTMINRLTINLRGDAGREQEGPHVHPVVRPSTGSRTNDWEATKVTLVSGEPNAGLIEVTRGRNPRSGENTFEMRPVGPSYV